MRNSPHESKGVEWQLGNHYSTEGVAEEGDEDDHEDAYEDCRFELEGLQFLGEVFELVFCGLEFLFVGFRAATWSKLELFLFLGFLFGLFDLFDEGFVLGGSVDGQPGEAFGEKSCEYSDSHDVEKIFEDDVVFHI